MYPLDDAGIAEFARFDENQDGVLCKAGLWPGRGFRVRANDRE